MIYEDVLRYRRTTPEYRKSGAKCLLLRDQIVECRLRINYLLEGALDPLVVEILRTITTSDKSIKLGVLAARVWDAGSESRRVVAETVAVLKRWGVVIVSDDSEDPTVSASPFYSSNVNSGMDAIVRNYDFVPRAGHLRERMLSMSTEQLEPVLLREPQRAWWSDPNDASVYSHSTLSSSICSAFAHLHAGNIVRDVAAAPTPLHEPVQRAHLMVGRSRPYEWSLDGQPRRREDRWVLFRCFAFMTNAKNECPWTFEVYRYPQGPYEHQYSRYILEADIEVRNVLLDLGNDIDDL